MTEGGHYAETAGGLNPYPLSDSDIKSFTGKLSFKDSNGADHYCTAQIIDKNVILTAAHCVRNIFNGFSFKFDGSVTPHSVKCISRAAYWYDPGYPEQDIYDPFINVRFDYAFVQLGDNPAIDKPASIEMDWSNSWPVTAKQWKLSNNKLLNSKVLVQSIGYPAAESASVAYDLPANPFLEFYHPNINAIATLDTNFSDGISGGAWLLRKGNKYNVESINSSYSKSSFVSGSSPVPYLTIYGPVLDADAHNLEIFAANLNNHPSATADLSCLSGS